MARDGGDRRVLTDEELEQYAGSTVDSPEMGPDVTPPMGGARPPMGTGLKIGRVQGARANNGKGKMSTGRKRKKVTGNPVRKKQKVSAQDVADAKAINDTQTGGLAAGYMLSPEERRRRRRSIPGSGGMVGVAESMQ